MSKRPCLLFPQRGVLKRQKSRRKLWKLVEDSEEKLSETEKTVVFLVAGVQ